MTTIGILGAGKLGITLAQLALHAGFEVSIAGSRNPEKIALTINVLTPGATAKTAEEVSRDADVIILALPLGEFRTIPKQALAGKLVIDAMNYWWEVDGSRDEIINPDISSTEAVQELLTTSRVVKAFNHMGYHNLHDEHRPAGTSGRKAIAIAGDAPKDVESVAKIVNEFGFDPVVIGKLSEGVRLEPGKPAFGANVNADELKNMIANTKLVAGEGK